jgi:hypothetical protein
MGSNFFSILRTQSLAVSPHVFVPHYSILGLFFYSEDEGSMSLQNVRLNVAISLKTLNLNTYRYATN